MASQWYEVDVGREHVNSLRIECKAINRPTDFARFMDREMVVREMVVRE